MQFDDTRIELSVFFRKKNLIDFFTELYIPLAKNQDVNKCITTKRSELFSVLDNFSFGYCWLFC